MSTGINDNIGKRQNGNKEENMKNGQQKADVYSRPNITFDEKGTGTITVRMSAASSACERALFYEAFQRSRRKGVTDADKPRDRAARTMLAMGNALEPVALDDLRLDGWEVIPNDSDESSEVRIGENMVLQGHHDAEGRPALFGGEFSIVEVKTRSSDNFRRWQTLGAERSNPDSVRQAALYSYGRFGEARNAVVSVMDVGNRVCDYEVIPAHRIERAYEAAVARMESLERRMRAEELPEPGFPVDHWMCRRCPFLEICGNVAPPAEENEGDESPVSQEEVEAAMAAYADADEELKQDHLKTAQKAKKEAQKTLLRYMRQGDGRKKVEFEMSDGRRRTVTLVSSRRFKVDHKRLNELLDPEDRAAVVTESVSEFVRVK